MVLSEAPHRRVHSVGQLKHKQPKVGGSPINLGPYSKKNKSSKHEKKNGDAGTTPPIQLGKITKYSEDEQ